MVNITTNCALLKRPRLVVDVFAQWAKSVFAPKTYTDTHITYYIMLEVCSTDINICVVFFYGAMEESVGIMPMEMLCTFPEKKISVHNEAVEVHIFIYLRGFRKHSPWHTLIERT